MYPSSTSDNQKPQNDQHTVGIPVNYAGVNQQHLPINPVQPGSESPWSTRLCGCGEDVPNCCITCWCPCITFGQIAEIVDRGATTCGTSGALYALIMFVSGCSCLYSCFYRTKLRQQYMLPEGHCGDCLVHCCCEPCALCQEYRELKRRGFDMSIGWQGNVQRQSQGVGMAPMVQGGMTRY